MKRSPNYLFRMKFRGSPFLFFIRAPIFPLRLTTVTAATWKTIPHSRKWFVRRTALFLFLEEAKRNDNLTQMVRRDEKPPAKISLSFHSVRPFPLLPAFISQPCVHLWFIFRFQHPGAALPHGLLPIR